MMFKKLMAWDKEGIDCDAVLKHSIENGYTGLFNPNSNHKPTPEVFSQAHQQIDVSKIGRGDADLDTSQDPFADLKEQ